MEYPLESLDPETFQRLCQAMLICEYPNVQCFPVAQPDGGRDAVILLDSPARDKFAMYQVKFVRQALTDRDPHKWLLEIMSKEAPKIAQQIPAGAQSFQLITNVSGTAHPNSGSIDSAVKLLKDHLGIPVSVWWRDDVMRRIDSYRELKWSFPQLLTGTDVLHALIGSDLIEHRDRRASAIRSFISDQYASDEEVKFKQVELQNKLLDLFIDVPIVLPNPYDSRRDKAGWMFRRIASDIVQREFNSVSNRTDREYHYDQERISIGSATLLLDHVAQRHLPLVVLEGAPGQGKSTVTQYIAQVHRMRLLDRQDILATIAQHHQSAPVRIPIKVALRDLATWQSRLDPFTAEGENVEPPGWNNSLESFLAALIHHYSGGAQFDVSDLHAVLRRNDVLLVFDGLDEVADIQRRQAVVEEIVRGVGRLSDIALSIQVIVTSRPAAFANSPGFPEEKYTYLQLNDVTRPLIDRYADNWIRARRIDQKQTAEVKRILRDKLDQPHLRDLARNPMQLAILLLRGLDEHRWHLLFESIEDCLGYRNRIQNIDTASLPVQLGPRTVSALSIRADAKTCDVLFDAYLSDYLGTDIAVLKVCERVVLARLSDASNDSMKLLDIIARSYAGGSTYEDYTFIEYWQRRKGASLPLDIAEHVLGTPAKYPAKYPGFLVAMSEATVNADTATRIIPVGDIAEQENWSFS